MERSRGSSLMASWAAPTRAVGGSARGAFVGGHALREMMEALLVDGEDRHLRTAEDGRVVERPDLDQHHTGHLGGPGQQVRAAFTAELPRHRVGEIATPKGLRGALRVLEAGLRHAHDDVRVSARDVLTFAAVALRLEDGVAVGLVTDGATVASTLKSHRVSSVAT